MKKNNNKLEYTQPFIKRIKIDNEISLVLESTPPSGPRESSRVYPECFNNDPFKNFRC